MNAFRWPARHGLALFVALTAAVGAFGQNSAPVLTSQPVSRTVTAGAAVSFSVTATGTPAPTYQWRKGTGNIIGATAATFSIPAAALGDAGSYSVVVANVAGSVTSASAVLTVNSPASAIVSGPTGVAAGTTATFTASASGGTPPLAYQWYKNAVAPANLIQGATGPTYTTPPLMLPADEESTYWVRITDASGIVTTASSGTLFVFKAEQSITFNAPTNAVVSPTPVALAATATSGLPVTFAVTSGPATASGGTVTFTGVGNVVIRALQPGNANYRSAPDEERAFTVGKGTPVITWAVPAAVVNGTALSATQLNATANVPGTFAYTPPIGTVVHPPAQTLSVTFTPANPTNYNVATAQRTLVVNAPPTARLSNASVRTVLAASQILIVGFTIQGGAKPMLVRAIGPGLLPFNVSNVMADPRLALYREANQLEANDNWGGGATLANAFAGLGAFVLQSASTDAALLRSIEGPHTAHVTGGAGAILVEAYDAGGAGAARLINLSARNRTGAGDVLIAGFVVEGTGELTVLVRGVGPSLSTVGVSGGLSDPRLEIYADRTRIADNDTWAATLAPTFASVGAFSLIAGSKDAALTIRLGRGAYTAQVSSVDGSAGEAVVEIYELP